MAKVSRPRVIAKQHLADLDLPAEVTLSLAELARSAKEHLLLSLSVALGLATLQELFADELTRLVGPKGKHHAERTAYRHGSERRFVTLGGRLVEIERPRARSRGGHELALATYTAVTGRDLLTEAALARMLAGLSSRRSRDGLEPVGDVRSRGTGRSAVSRRVVAGTAAKLAQLRSRDLSTLRLLALFIDGIEIAGTPSSSPSASTPRAQSTSWACGRARPRTPRSAARSLGTSSRAAFRPTARCASSSTAARASARRSPTATGASRSSTSVVCAGVRTSWTTSPRACGPSSAASSIRPGGKEDAAEAASSSAT